MSDKSVLVVDDEQNIRLTLRHTLEGMGLAVTTAVNGEEALQRLEQQSFDLMLLDLKLTGMDGLEVLRLGRLVRPGVPAVLITAHGSVESAVAAMKLGAADYLQKPFTPGEIRELVKTMLAREDLDERQATSSRKLVELAKRSILRRDFAVAMDQLQRVIASDPSWTEPYNLLGVLCEVQGDRTAARKYYRVALDLDPSFAPAASNLRRLTERLGSGGPDLNAAGLEEKAP